uniref:G-protein coupled receptors family 1 profile domain-containing protein n=1 Tax=Amphimedon queenslandica TaxID=400682 RepID=A0A1X7SYE6_AMPQE
MDTLDNNSSNSTTSTCDGLPTIDNTIIIIEEVFGGLGVMGCMVALVFAIVSRFYKDIVQRLILYKLIAMSFYSLSQFMLSRYANSITYKAMTVVIPHTFYCVNLVLTFWLTIVLHLCIVHLKELKNFKKLELTAIITSFLPFAIAAYTPFASLDTCTQSVYIIFTKKASGKNHDYAFIIGYSIVGILYLIISILVVFIFIVTIRRSRIHHRRQDDNEAESLLVNNKWKILSKQLLPLVVYPIVNTVMEMVFFPLSVLYFRGSTFKGVRSYSLITSSGLITGIIVIIHLCIVKCKKKQRERKRKRKNDESPESFCVVSNNHDDVFTRETVASSNAHTTYQYARTSSWPTDDQLSTLPIN